MCRKKRLQELKQFENLLRHKYNQYTYYKKLYEEVNNDIMNDDDGKIVIYDKDNNRHIFSTLPKEFFDYLIEKGYFDRIRISRESGEIKINSYSELLDTIECLIRVIEFDLM